MLPLKQLSRLATIAFIGSALVTSAQAPPAAAAAKPAGVVDPKLASYKGDLAAEIDSMNEFTQQMVDQVFSFGELGFQEFETSKYLTGILKKNGFHVEESVAEDTHGVDGYVGIG